MLLFGRDPNKAGKNIEIHGISFDEASTAFGDTLSLLFIIHCIPRKKTGWF